jgi:hypothetical protein
VWSDPNWGTRCSFTTYLPSFDFYNDAELTDPPGGRFLMIGETFDYRAEELRPFVDPDELLDGQFDFPFKEQVCRAVLRTDASHSWPVSENLNEIDRLRPSPPNPVAAVART